MAAEIGRVDEQIALQQRRITLAEHSYKRFSDLQAADYFFCASASERVD